MVQRRRSKLNSESLRQKNSCWTQLWRESALRDHQRGKPTKGKLSGFRTENYAQRGQLCPFLCPFSMKAETLYEPQKKDF